MSKIFFFDVETTGVSPKTDSIYQISGIIEIDGQIVETFDIKMKPQEFDSLPEDYVTPVGGITKQMMYSFQSPAEAYRQLIGILNKHVDKYNSKDKFFASGFNSQSFDMQFFREFFSRNNDKYFGSWFWPISLDVMILAAQYLIDRRIYMVNFKLETVAAELGIKAEGEGFHDAFTDINVTRGIYHVVKVK